MSTCYIDKVDILREPEVYSTNFTRKVNRSGRVYLMAHSAPDWLTALHNATQFTTEGFSVPYTQINQLTGAPSEITPMDSWDMWILKTMLRKVSEAIDHYERLPNNVRKDKLIEAYGAFIASQERIKVQLRQELAELAYQHLLEKADHRRAGCDRKRAAQMELLQQRVLEWSEGLQTASAEKQRRQRQTAAAARREPVVTVPVQLNLL